MKTKLIDGTDLAVHRETVGAKNNVLAKGTRYFVDFIVVSLINR